MRLATTGVSYWASTSRWRSGWPPVTPEFVRFSSRELVAQVQARTVDIVMSGARLTPLRAAAFAVSEPYLEETLAIVTLDEARRKFQSWEAIRQLGAVQLGVRTVARTLMRGLAAPDSMG